jgi:hypothetical protein
VSTLQPQRGQAAPLRQPNTKLPARLKVSPIQVPVPKKKKDGPQYEFSTETEICTSPSWSDFGGRSEKKERKKAEKERKELEKKLKKEREKEEKASKASKRLSKVPPLAKLGKGKPTEERSSIPSEQPTEPTASSSISIDFSLLSSPSKAVSINSSASSLEPAQKPFQQTSPTHICEPTPPSTRPSSSVDISPTIPPGTPQDPSAPYTRHASHHPSALMRAHVAGSRSTWTAGRRAFSDQPGRPLGKCFFICCGCLRWHDLPADIFEMIFTRKVSDPESNKSDNNSIAQHGMNETPSASLGKQRVAVETNPPTYPCPWCEHGMSADCCAAWTTIVYFHTRHH